MLNIKAVATATDGSVKRMAITYDIINEEGKVTTSNAKLNRVVVDHDALSAIDVLEKLALNSVSETLEEK